jgi:hemerythrin superfamily protein
MDAITLLKNDHREVEKLFKRFEKAGDNAHVQKRDIVDRIIEELSKHAAIEEQLFYPVTRATVPDVEDTALESIEEHHIVKWVLNELDGMDPRDERFDAKVTVLIENVRHHVEEEEEDYFPKVRDELGRKSLAHLGDAMEQAKATAPTHPHPRSPDAPPGNILANAGAGAIDRITDTVSGVAQGSVSALQDVIALVTGSKKRASAARGTPTTKRAANRTRSRASSATKRTTSAVKKARRTGENAVDDTRREVAKRVRPPAKRTARKRTTTARKRPATTRKATGRKATGRKAASGARKATARKTASSARKATKRTAGAAKRTSRATKRTAKRTTSAAKRTATTARKRTTNARKSTGRRTSARSSR